MRHWTGAVSICRSEWPVSAVSAVAGCASCYRAVSSRGVLRVSRVREGRVRVLMLSRSVRLLRRLLVSARDVAASMCFPNRAGLVIKPKQAPGRFCGRSLVPRNGRKIYASSVSVVFRGMLDFGRKPLDGTRCVFGLGPCGHTERGPMFRKVVVTTSGQSHFASLMHPQTPSERALCVLPRVASKLGHAGSRGEVISPRSARAARITRRPAVSGFCCGRGIHADGEASGWLNVALRRLLKVAEDRLAAAFSDTRVISGAV